MSKIKDTFFGGAEKRAAKKQVEATQEGQRLLAASTERARTETRPLFQEARDRTPLAFEEARGIFNEILPQQAALFQGGNLAAQETLLTGLPQIQNAILGNAPIDLSGLQPQSQQLQGRLAPPQQAPLATPPPAEAGGFTTVDPNIAGAPVSGIGGGSILSQIQAGTLEFSSLTPEQRQQFIIETQNNRRTQGNPLERDR